MAIPDLGDKPGLAKLSLTKGQPWSRNITLQTNAKPPVAIDLTGYTLHASIRKNAACGSLGDLTITMLDEVVGRFTLALPAELSADLRAGQYADDECGAYEVIVTWTDSLSVQRTLLVIKVQVGA